MKTMRSVIVSNGVPYFQITSVGPHRTSGREKKERMDRDQASDQELHPEMAERDCKFQFAMHNANAFQNTYSIDNKNGQINTIEMNSVFTASIMWGPGHCWNTKSREQ